MVGDALKPCVGVSLSNGLGLKLGSFETDGVADGRIKLVGFEVIVGLADGLVLGL